MPLGAAVHWGRAIRICVNTLPDGSRGWRWVLEAELGALRVGLHLGWGVGPPRRAGQRRTIGTGRWVEGVEAKG